MRSFLNLTIALVFVSVFAQGQQTRLHTFKIKNVSELQEFFTYSSDRVPLLCGHRGGATTGYPENAIATLEYTLSKTPAFLR